MACGGGRYIELLSVKLPVAAPSSSTVHHSPTEHSGEKPHSLVFTIDADSVYNMCTAQRKEASKPILHMVLSLLCDREIPQSVWSVVCE